MRTFKDIQDEVLSYGWGSADRQRVQTWINSAYVDVASRTRWSWTQDSVAVVATVGAQTTPVPGNIAMWGRLRPLDADGAEPQFVDWHSYNAALLAEPGVDLADGLPEVYSLNGGLIYWAPIPDAAYMYTAECWVTPSVLVGDTDEPRVPLPDREVLMAGACLRAASRDQNMAMMKYWGDQFEGMVAKLKQKQNLAQSESPRYVPMPAAYGGMFG